MDETLLGFLLLLQSLTRLASSLSILDFSQVDLSVPTRSSGRCTSVLPVLDPLQPGLPLLPRRFTHPNFTVFVFGCWCMGLSVPSVDFAFIGFPVPLRSFIHPELAMLMFDMSHLSSSLLVKVSTCLDLPLLLFGLTCFNSVFSLSVCDMARLDFLLLLQSHAHFDFPLPILHHATLDSSLPTRSFSSIDLIVFLVGISRPDSVFALLAMGEMHSGSLTLAHSFARAEVLVFLLGFSTLGSFPSLRCCSHTSSSLPVCGIGRAGFALLVLGSIDLESFTLLQSHSHLEPVASLIAFAESDSAVLMRSCARIGLVLPLLGIGRPGSVFTLSVLDKAHFDSLLPLRSFGHLGFVLSVFDCSVLGFVMFLRGYAQLASLMLLLGLARAGFVFSLSVLDASQLDPNPSLHSFACLSPMPLIVDLAGVNSSVFLRSPVCLELSLPVADSSRLDSFASMRQLLRLESTAFPVGLGRIGFCFPLSVLEDCHLDSPLPTHSLSHPGFILFALDYAQMEFSVFLHSLSQASLSLSALNFAEMGLLLSARSSARIELLLLAIGCSRVGLAFSLFVIDTGHLELSTPVRSFVRMALSAFALDLLHSGSLVSMQAYGRVGSRVSICDRSTFDFFLLILDFAMGGFSASLRSFVHLGIALSAFDTCQPDFVLLLRSLARGDFLLLIFGLV